MMAIASLAPTNPGMTDKITTPGISDYDAFDRVGNDMFQFDCGAASAIIHRLFLLKDGVVTTGASYLLHVYSGSTAPTVYSSDNQLFKATYVNYIGAIPVVVDQLFTDSSATGNPFNHALGIGSSAPGFEVGYPAGAGSLYFVLQVLPVYKPTVVETYTLKVEVLEY